MSYTKILWIVHHVWPNMLSILWLGGLFVHSGHPVVAKNLKILPVRILCGTWVLVEQTVLVVVAIDAFLYASINKSRINQRAVARYAQYEIPGFAPCAIAPVNILHHSRLHYHENIISRAPLQTPPVQYRCARCW